MNIIDVPFGKHVGLKQENKNLILEPRLDIENHIGTIHASAQFTLAETQSALFLQSEFPHIGEVVPLLRSSTVKYKAPATTKLTAIATISDEVKVKFEEQFSKKGRATISLKVEVKDLDNTLTMVGEFTWFIQKV